MTNYCTHKIYDYLVIRSASSRSTQRLRRTPLSILRGIGAQLERRVVVDVRWHSAIRPVLWRTNTFAPLYRWRPA
ncbi:hypothetical protein LCGC14_0698910 [marine sediment metagenome]|uniref:Uncharacterized protein n=1 Tax=marine sediment metagenome TaxID=412755 RepID=A0A0F9R3T9_9ZZZZ